MIHFDVVRDGTKFSARADDGTTLTIGAKVRFRNKKTGVDRFGLSNDGNSFGSTLAKKHLYVAADHHADFPFWSDFIEPTAMCEGQSYLSLNTYDRAHFTFGFAQFAATYRTETLLSGFGTCWVDLKQAIIFRISSCATGAS